MDVSEILKLLATLSIGLDDPTDSDIVVFMQYINLCYTEILQETLAQNPHVNIIDDLLDCNAGIVDPTTFPIFIPISVYDIAKNAPLTATTREDVLKKDPGLKTLGTGTHWYMSGGNINLHPIGSSLLDSGNGIGVKYIAEPDMLTASSASSDILIPKMYQNILADGASYYLFQSETGFKDQTKMQASMMRWDLGKQKLFSYMKNLGGKKIFSTFSLI